MGAGCPGHANSLICLKNRILRIEKPEYYHTLNVRGQLIDFQEPGIMGIINITDDSFYSGSRADEKNLLEKASRMVEEGCDMLDIGAQSTRPGAVLVPASEELRRIPDAISLLSRHFPALPVSCDTFYAEVAAAAVDAGAAIINDVSGGLADTAMFETVGKLGVPYVLMHRSGLGTDFHSPMDQAGDLTDINLWFSRQINRLIEAGVNDIILDPGFGFGKSVGQNYAFLRQLPGLSLHNRPVIAGISRKSMIWRQLGTDAEGALNGTTALHMVALMNGADILRVHDVKAACEVRTLARLLKTSVASPL